MVVLTRLIRLVLVLSALTVVATANGAWALDPTPVPAPDGFSIRVSRVAGLPGESIEVEFHDAKESALYQCGVYDKSQPNLAANCVDGANKVRTATVAVPRVPPGEVVELTWWIDPLYQVYSPSPLDGSFDVTVLGVEATTQPEVATPGKPVTITLNGQPDGLRITSCTVELGGAEERCDGGRATVLVPADTPPGSELPLSWKFDYAYGKNNDKGRGEGGRPIRVAPPLPEIEAQQETETAAPGLPFAVTFISRTAGVTVTGCVLTYRPPARCNPSGVAVVTIPLDTPVDSTITLPWTVYYTSTRPGDGLLPVDGYLKIPVVAVQPRFTATEQPARARPGDEVTVTLEPVDPGVTIVGCQAFFPHGVGAFCQRSPKRWFARTRVPADAQPGATLLRWGVEALTADGRLAADNGVLPFQVLAAGRPSKPTSAPTSSPTSAPTSSPTSAPTSSPTSAPTSSPTSAPTSRAAEPQPVFVAVTDPEAAEPGQRVSVTIQPLTAGTTITGCHAAFAGTDGSACEPSGARWTASVTVPDDARPGDLPLRWNVTARTGAGAGGTVTYRVLGSGPPPRPEFEIGLDPTSVRPGGHVAVTNRAYDEGVAITGCSAGYTPGGAMAACRDTGQGWVADVVVPENAPPGTGILYWQVAYARSGDIAPGSTNGSVGMAVLPPPTEQVAWLSRLWGIVWRGGAGALGLAALIGLRAAAGPVRKWRERRRRDAGGLPEGVSVTVVRPFGPASATAADPDAAPRRVIRLTIHRGVPNIRLHEELR
jgi:hypothetical protein